MTATSGAQETVRALRGGGLFVHPTETIYGIGGLLSGSAPDLLRTMKRRPEGGFVILLPDRNFSEALLPPVGRQLADAFWPGPLTLIVDDPADVFPPRVKAGNGSVAIRLCGNPVTTAFLEFLGEPVTSTSANVPGGAPARSFRAARDAAHTLGADVSGLDGGTLPNGPPSTLIDVRGESPEVLREGGVPTGSLTPFLDPGRTGSDHD